MRRDLSPVLVLVLWLVPAFSQDSSPVASQPSTTASDPGSAQPIPPDSTKLIPIKMPKANYPLVAQQRKIQGEVMLNVVVSETGDVDSVEVLSGDPVLADAAVSAAKKWKFQPFIKNGKPVKVSTKLPLDFAFGDQVTDVSPPADASNSSSPNGQAQNRVRVASGVMVGMLIHKVAPIYPEQARRNYIQGTVILEAEIDKTGRIANLKLVSGPKELVDAAVGAVQQWRYRPYTLNNEPVIVQTQVQVNFQLRR